MTKSAEQAERSEQSANDTPADLETLFVLLNEIGIINQLSSHQFNSVLPDDLTRAQFSVLNNFVRLGGSRTPSQLAKAFQVTKGAMTNTLKRLAERGCVKISTDPSDTRSKQVNITARGRKLREKAIVATYPQLQALSQVLSTQEIAQMLPLLQKLRSYLDNHR